MAMQHLKPQGKVFGAVPLGFSILKQRSAKEFKSRIAIKIADLSSIMDIGIGKHVWWKSVAMRQGKD